MRMRSNKLKVVLTFIVSYTVMFIPVYSYGGVIFEDDFESSPSNWVCDPVTLSGPNSNWSPTYTECGVSPGFGPEWRMGPGHNSANALYAYKSSVVPNGYRSEADRWLSGADVKTEIYHRWYMKVPPASSFNKACNEGFKFWRYMLHPNGTATPSTLYLNVQCGGSGNTFANGNLVALPNANAYYTLIPISSFNDGQWHSHELRLKINTNGNQDGILQYWFDGVLKASYTNFDFGQNVGSSYTGMAVSRFGVGIGNTSSTPWFQTTWSAVAFDDVVVSTNYIGPSGTSGALSPPSDLIIQ